MSHRHRKPNLILQAINDPTKNFLAFFLLTVLLLNLLSGGISDFFWENLSPWLQKFLNIQNQATFQLWVIGGLLAVTLLIIYFTSLARWVTHILKRFGLLPEIETQINVCELTESSYRGLIVIMSIHDDSPAEFAIRHHWEKYHLLEYCWLICTDESVVFARRLKQKFVEEGLDAHFHCYSDDAEIPDPHALNQTLSLTVNSQAVHDPNYIMHLVNGIYAHAESLELSEEEIIVDFTGGTKPLGVGVFLACVSPSRHLEYITLDSQSQAPKILEIHVAYDIKSIR